MTTIVFSRDRALQLDAFLRSFARFVEPRPNVDVIWMASSNTRHIRAYQQVFERHPWAVSHCQKFGRFKADVLACLPETGCVVFFVDDVIFTRPWQVHEAPGWSLRLGWHLTRCYTENRPQALPDAQQYGEAVRWRWGSGDGDWGYPLSLDGHVFDVGEMRTMIDRIGFTSPNTLEANLQVFAPSFQDRLGACYREAKIVNVPWNRVQVDCDNRFSRDRYATPQRLLGVWEQGQQIDLEPFVGVLNESCHQEFPLTLEPRS